MKHNELTIKCHLLNELQYLRSNKMITWEPHNTVVCNGFYINLRIGFSSYSKILLFTDYYTFVDITNWCIFFKCSCSSFKKIMHVAPETSFARLCRNVVVSLGLKFVKWSRRVNNAQNIVELFYSPSPRPSG